MAAINLEEEEWRQIMSVLMHQATWIVANPLLSKITEQLAKQRHGNSGEMREMAVPQGHLENEKRQ